MMISESAFVNNMKQGIMIAILFAAIVLFFVTFNVI
jgi:hypothetical protein